MDPFAAALSAAAAVAQPNQYSAGVSNKRPRDSHQTHAHDRAAKTNQVHNRHGLQTLVPQRQQDVHGSNLFQPPLMVGGYTPWAYPAARQPMHPAMWGGASFTGQPHYQNTGSCPTVQNQVSTFSAGQYVKPMADPALQHLSATNTQIQLLGTAQIGAAQNQLQSHSYASRIAYGSGPSRDSSRQLEPHRAHWGASGEAQQRYGAKIETATARKRVEVPQSHKVFVGGLPQTATEGEILQYFEKVGGPIADVILMKDPATGRLRGFGFVMFRSIDSVDKVVAADSHRAQLHEIRPGKYVDVKRAVDKDELMSTARGEPNTPAPERSSTKLKHQTNACMDCGKRNPKYGMPNEKRKRWCGDCAQKNHPEAVKSRSSKERAQREDRSHVFQWARNLDPPRCAYWIVAQCPNVKNNQPCERVHECKNCGALDAEYKHLSCPNCPHGWWRDKSANLDSGLVSERV